MASARMLPPSGPLVVQTLTPASAVRRPPSQTSADKTTAARNLGTIVFFCVIMFVTVATEFVGVLTHRPQLSGSQVIPPCGDGRLRRGSGFHWPERRCHPHRGVSIVGTPQIREGDARRSHV